MRKAGALCLVLVLVLISIFLPLLAVAAATTVFMDAPAEVAPGADFVARANISDVVNFDSCDYYVTYDPAVIEVTEVINGSIAGTEIPVDMWGFIPIGVQGTVRVIGNVPGVPGVSGSGYLAEVHFHVVGSAGDTSPLYLYDGTLNDNAAVHIAANWFSDSVAISGAAPTEPNISFSPQSFSFWAAAGEANPVNQALEVWNSGVGSLDWSLSSSAAWLALNPTSGRSSGERDAVTLSVNIAGMSAADYSATITISAPGAANTPQTVSASLTIAPPGSTPPAPAPPGVAIISLDAPASVKAGGNFVVKVNIDNVSNLGSWQYDVVFDPAVLEVTDVSSGEIASSTMPVEAGDWNMEEAGGLRVMGNMGGSSPASGSGYLSQLHFRVIGQVGDTSNISLANGLLRDSQAQDIDAHWQGCSVAVGGASGFSFPEFTWYMVAVIVLAVAVVATVVLIVVRRRRY